MATTSPSYEPVAFFCGDDAHAMEKEVSLRIEQRVAPEARPFDLEILYADEVTADAVINSASTFPILGSTRLVVLRRLEAWRAQVSELRRLAAEYVLNPSPTTHLIVCLQGGPGFAAAPRKQPPGSPPDRARILAVLAPRKAAGEDGEAAAENEGKRWGSILRAFVELAGEIAVFEPADQPQITSWVEKHFQKKGIRCANGVAKIFAERLGGDIHRLKRELEKMELYCAGREGPLRPEDVQALLERTLERSVFVLSDALKRRDRMAAARLIEEFLADGDAPLAILHREFAPRFRQVIRSLAAGEEKAAAARGSAAPAEAEAARRGRAEWDWTAERARSLERAFARLLEADARLKRSRAEPSAILQTLLAELLT